MIQPTTKQQFFEHLEKLSLDNRYAHVMRRYSISADTLAETFQLIMQDEVIENMMRCLEKYDETTYLHSVDLFILTYVFGFKGQPISLSFLKGALLHDIGKLLVPKEILIKNGKLTESEYEEIKKHTIIGDSILKDKGYIVEALLARGHHERLDGTGYPDGLYANQINSHLRLLAVLDVYSALTLPRPYKHAFSNAETLEILKEKNDQYDKIILDDLIQEINDLTIKEH